MPLRTTTDRSAMGQWTAKYELEREIYRNPLASKSDVVGFRLEGDTRVTFANGRMRLENALEPAEGQRANFVFWCPHRFESDIAISWNFWPVREPGLCILFFAATGRHGQDVFESSLATRTGEYAQYHHGDINAYHVSYFRRKHVEERAFHTCNLRKSYGFHLVAQGADPLPDIVDATPPYRIMVIKCGPHITFVINDLQILEWCDGGDRHGPPLGPGKVGFRQMAPLVAEYSDLRVHRVQRRQAERT